MKSLDNLMYLLSEWTQGHTTSASVKIALQDYVREECQAVLSQREALVDMMAADAKDGLYEFDGKEAFSAEKITAGQDAPIIVEYVNTDGTIRREPFSEFMDKSPKWFRAIYFDYGQKPDNNTRPPKYEVKDRTQEKLDQYKGMKTRAETEAKLKKLNDFGDRYNLSTYGKMEALEWVLGKE